VGNEPERKTCVGCYQRAIFPFTQPSHHPNQTKKKKFILHQFNKVPIVYTKRGHKRTVQKTVFQNARLKFNTHPDPTITGIKKIRINVACIQYKFICSYDRHNQTVCKSLDGLIAYSTFAIASSSGVIQLSISSRFPAFPTRLPW
jgi:hypothetical protein